jgi:hypothetical protein
MPLPIPSPEATIKDKPSNIGLKDIVNKDSWLDAKKVIDAQLHCSSYWPGPSKELVMTADDMLASAWWEEVIVYYCKPPVLDLFVEELDFNGKGFEMISYINAHFKPSSAEDSLGYIFDLINIKQLVNKLVVTLKAPFSHLFTSLKMRHHH